MSIPAGKWVIDPSHSSVTFSVRHLMISKVKGSFGAFNGDAVVTDANTTLTGEVDVTSINTNDEGRDGHLRSADFFDVENHPTVSFRAEGFNVPAEGEANTLEGELTVKGITRPVTFKVELGGVVVDGYGNTKAAAELSTKINRNDFGLNWNSALETGGVLVGEEVTINLDVQAVLAEPTEVIVNPTEPAVL